jgi:hypothetical protein
MCRFIVRMCTEYCVFLQRMSSSHFCVFGYVFYDWGLGSDASEN